MIDPENDKFNDTEPEADEQPSQQDIHSDGLDTSEPLPDDIDGDIARLKQADKASESAYTLNVERDAPPAKKD